MFPDERAVIVERLESLENEDRHLTVADVAAQLDIDLESK